MNKMLFFLSFLLPLVSAHMTMVDPPALGLKTNKFTQENDVDYSLSSPLSTMSDFPCKGKLKMLGTPSGQSVATWAAGSSQTFSLQAGAPHGGGSCQASISEDQGKTWKVIKSYIGACPDASSQANTVEPFTVPKNTMNGDVVFGWTWFNFEGNREMYMNCAVVTISGGGSSPGLSSLPDTFVANIGNGCTVPSNTNVLFPNPGTDVLTKATGTPPTGTCGTASSGNGSGSSPAVSPVASSPAATGGSGAATSVVAPIASSPAATGGSGAATSVAAPIASSIKLGNNGLYTSSIAYNNGLYTAPTSVKSVPTIVPSVISPAVSSPVSPPVNPIASSAAATTSCDSSTMPVATGTAVAGTPIATSSAYNSPDAAAPSGSAIPNCKRSVRYTRSEPKVIPRSPGCMCQCSGGGVPQLIGQCS